MIWSQLSKFTPTSNFFFSIKLSFQFRWNNITCIFHMIVRVAMATQRYRKLAGDTEEPGIQNVYIQTRWTITGIHPGNMPGSYIVVCWFNWLHLLHQLTVKIASTRPKEKTQLDLKYDGLDLTQNLPWDFFGLETWHLGTRWPNWCTLYMYMYIYMYTIL